MVEDEQMLKLLKEIDICTKCPLHKTRKNALTGDGRINSKILLIGEAPGQLEDEKKKAFIGRAGQVLDTLLKEINLTRNNIYITNIVKCRPPQNRNPSPFEITQCLPYLKNQLKIIKPKIIITLGNIAGKEIFEIVKIPFSKISKMHGRQFEIKTSYGQVLLIASYHPAAALHNPNILSTVKADFIKINLIF